MCHTSHTCPNKRRNFNAHDIYDLVEGGVNRIALIFLLLAPAFKPGEDNLSGFLKQIAHDCQVKPAGFALNSPKIVL